MSHKVKAVAKQPVGVILKFKNAFAYLIDVRKYEPCWSLMTNLIKSLMNHYGQLIVTNERISVKRWRCSLADD